MSDVEETLKRINAHKGVLGILICNNDGVVIRSTYETNHATKMSAHSAPLLTKAVHMVRDLDPQNDLLFLRLKSKKHEIMVRSSSPRYHFVAASFINRPSPPWLRPPLLLHYSHLFSLP